MNKYFLIVHAAILAISAMVAAFMDFGANYMGFPFGYLLLCIITASFWASIQIYQKKKLVALSQLIIVIKYPFLIAFVWWVVRHYSSRGSHVIETFVGGIVCFILISALLLMIPSQDEHSQN